MQINPSLSSKGEPASWKERFISLKGSSASSSVFALVMGGLMGGIFTPTEAGAVGALAMIVVSLFYRKLTWSGSFGAAFLEAARTSAMILLLIMGARYFSYFLTSTEIASRLSDSPRRGRVSACTWS